MNEATFTGHTSAAAAPSSNGAFMAAVGLRINTETGVLTHVLTTEDAYLSTSLMSFSEYDGFRDSAIAVTSWGSCRNAKAYRLEF